MSLSFWIRDYVFFPLAVLRRETWWRHLALVVSMVLFGVWHRGSLLFVIWGFYHGVLLILHRQIQRLERKFRWEPPGTLWSGLSWIATIASVSLGWIFFRSNSVSQAKAMLAAVISPQGYTSHSLSLSLYALVAALGAGYALVLLIAGVLDGQAEHAVARARTGALALIARWRWFWIPAVYALALLFVLMITQTQQGGAGQFVYRSF